MARGPRKYGTRKQQPNSEVSVSAKETPKGKSEEEKVADALINLAMTEDYEHAMSWAKRMPAVDRKAVLIRSDIIRSRVP